MNDNSDLEGVKSEASLIQEFIRFVNRSDRDVGIFWINYVGLPAFYKILGPLEYLDVNTYVGHPWICVDIKTKERYFAEGNRIYFPSPGYENRVLNKTEPGLVRIQVKITAPIRDLKTLAFKQLTKMVSKEEDVSSLELPLSLEKELKIFVRQEKRFQSMNIMRNLLPHNWQNR